MVGGNGGDQHTSSCRSHSQSSFGSDAQPSRTRSRARKRRFIREPCCLTASNVGLKDCGDLRSNERGKVSTSENRRVFRSSNLRQIRVRSGCSGGAGASQTTGIRIRTQFGRSEVVAV